MEGIPVSDFTPIKQRWLKKVMGELIASRKPRIIADLTAYRGRYDGIDGSPIIISNLARKILKEREYKILLVEKKAENYEHLLDSIKELPNLSKIKTYQEKQEEALLHLRSDFYNKRGLIYIDPCGSFKFSPLETTLKDPRCNKLDVVFNFSLTNCRRFEIIHNHEVIGESLIKLSRKHVFISDVDCGSKYHWIQVYMTNALSKPLRENIEGFCGMTSIKSPAGKAIFGTLLERRDKMAAKERYQKTRGKKAKARKKKNVYSMAADKAIATRRDPKIKPRAVRLLKKGKSVASVAATLDISKSFVYTIRDEYAIDV